MTRRIDIALELERIGKDVHGPADSQDPMDALLHELDVASIMSSYAEKRKDNAKSAVLAALSEAQANQVDRAVASTKELGIGETVNIVDAQNNGLDLQTKNGASFLDATKLKNELTKQLGATQANALIAQCTSKREPSKSFIVVEYGDK